MQQLSGPDAAFPAMETSSVHGHVGSICVLDPSTSPAPLALERLQGVIAEQPARLTPGRWTAADRSGSCT